MLIIGVALAGSFGALAAYLSGGAYWAVLICAAIVGGTSNPLYALLIAYANDYLARDKMASADGGLLFVNGLGAASGPLILGWMMDRIGPEGYWAYVSMVLGGIALYAMYRMTQRDRTLEEFENVPYAPIPATSSTMIAEVAQDYYAEAEEEVLANLDGAAEDSDHDEDRKT